MAGRMLGDVPGLDNLLPSNGAVLPSGYSVTEVNALGDITADSGLGDMLSATGSSDPFAYRVGELDQPQDGVEGGGSQGPAVVSDPMQSSYMPSVSTDSSGTAPTSSLTGAAYDTEQVANATTISEVGKKLGASDRDVQIALMAAMVESNLKNINYGDRDSLGLFQQRDAWGSAEDRTNPAKAAEMFFLGGHGGQQGLLDIKDRDTRPMGDVAQDVQVSAYPDRYAEHQVDAVTLLDSIKSGGATTRGKSGNDPYGLTQIDGETVDNFTAAALGAATKELGSGFRVIQGSHTTEIGASANTHAGGGVLDVAPADGDWLGALTALRKIGFAAWIRNMPGYGQAGEGAHIHAVLIGNEQLSPEAAQQVQSYLNNDDGLSGTRADDGPRQYLANRFVWGAQKQQGPTWRDKVIKDAKTYLGTPFKWGGKDFSGVDTTGFIAGVYDSLGVDLPKTTFDLAHSVKPIDVNASKPGDLIAWNKGESLGVYLGNGQIIEAGAPGRVVQLNDLGQMALDAWGVPMEKVINQLQLRANPLARPAPSYTPSVTTNPGTVTHTQISPGTSVVEPHASIPAPKHHKPSGDPITASDYANKPHGPM